MTEKKGSHSLTHGKPENRICARSWGYLGGCRKPSKTQKTHLDEIDDRIVASRRTATMREFLDLLDLYDWLQERVQLRERRLQDIAGRLGLPWVMEGAAA